MLEHWKDCPRRRGESKEKLIHYCIEIWGGRGEGGEEIKNHVIWPRFDTFEKWTCKALSNYAEDKEPQDQEEKEYAKLWERSRIGLFSLKTKKEAAAQCDIWDPLDHLPLPYLVPTPPPQVSPSASPAPAHEPVSAQVSLPGVLNAVPAQVPASSSLQAPQASSQLPPPLLLLPSDIMFSQAPLPTPPATHAPPLALLLQFPETLPPHISQTFSHPISLGPSPPPEIPSPPTQEHTPPPLPLFPQPAPQITGARKSSAVSSPPASRTRLKAKRMNEEENECEDERHNLLPLREVPITFSH